MGQESSIGSVAATAFPLLRVIPSLARSLTYSISCSKGIKLTRAAQLVHFQFILTAAASASTRSESGKRQQQQQQQQQQNNEKRLFAVKYSQLRSPAQKTDSKINPGKYSWSSSVYVRTYMHVVYGKTMMSFAGNL